MSLREYYTCENCGFSYETANYYFCARNDTGVIEKYESLFSTVGYSDGSIVHGRVIQNYCRHCDRIVSVYQTGLGASLFIRDDTIDFLRTFIPKKREKLLKTSVILENFVTSLQANEIIEDLRKYLEDHDGDLYYKIDIDDYMGDKAFESMDFNMDDYVDGENYRLKLLYDDLSNHVRGCRANDLNLKELYRDIEEKFDYLSEDLRDMEREIPVINYFGDEFNVTLDGEEIADGICPECGEEFYVISPDNPCPKCGQKKIRYDYVFCD